VKGPGSGLKVATESFTQSCHPGTMDREVLPSESEAMARITRTHLRIGKRCLHSVVCPYTVTPDFGFLIDRHPVARDVWVASPCSGHGFKHSAAVGEILAEVSIGQPSPMDLSAFAWRF
ncbi:MAG: FAD-dependent oxidoreductase, partial [Limisphaerales bacterium]